MTARPTSTVMRLRLSGVSLLALLRPRRSGLRRWEPELDRDPGADRLRAARAIRLHERGRDERTLLVRPVDVVPRHGRAVRVLGRGSVRRALRGAHPSPSTCPPSRSCSADSSQDSAERALRTSPTSTTRAAGRSTLVQDGTVGYVRLPAFDEQLPEGKTWIRADAADASTSGFDVGELGQFAKSDPRDVLGTLRAVTSDVETVGSEELRGVETTHYRATIDPAQLGKLAAREGIRRRPRRSSTGWRSRASARCPWTCGSTRPGSSTSLDVVRGHGGEHVAVERGGDVLRALGLRPGRRHRRSRRRRRSSTPPPYTASQRDGAGWHGAAAAERTAFRDSVRPGFARADPCVAPEWARCEFPLERVQATIRRHDLIQGGGEIACLVSGGADSTCLWHVLAPSATASPPCT